MTLRLLLISTPESAQPVQCCPGYTDLLRLLYERYDYHVCYSLSRIQGNTHWNHHRHHGIFADMCRSHTAAIVQIRQRCARCGRLQGRSRSDARSSRTGTARDGAESRCYPSRRVHRSTILDDKKEDGARRGETPETGHAERSSRATCRKRNRRMGRSSTAEDGDCEPRIWL